ncbi:3918_t:CDS:2, partial [Racocetra fulgida]
MGMGLDKLVKCLGGEIEKFPLTINYFTEKGYLMDKIKLLFRKGVFPYDWTNAWEKFDKTSLPSRKDFYSLLSQQNISKEDYEHAKKVWQVFEMKNFGEYHDLYLEMDVLLLADIFMNYIIMCLKDDGLDPSHYVSAPGMFNDSLYKSSRAELKLMTDKDEYLMVENGIRGGMTMASHRYAKSNNLQCPDYDPSKLKSWTLYEDMNALYSEAMTQYMPTEILGKVSPEEVPDIQSIAPDAEIGYMLELDLEAPVHLHDYFADYPLASEKQIIPENWLSLYNKRLVNDKEVGNGKYASGEKLVQTLYPKKNYVVHYRALQIYMKFGMKVTKIHSAFKFRQSPWMKDYIEENIRKRKIAKANVDEFGDETKGGPIGESVCLKPKMYSVLPAGHDPKTPDDPDSEDPKKKHGIQKAKGVKKCVGKKYDNLAKNYGDYLKKLRAKKNPNDYIKTVAVKMFPNEEAYTIRLENYRNRYADEDLYVSLEELYALYYLIAKEENRERSDDEIEQILK